MVRLLVYFLQVVNPEFDSHSMGGHYWIINVQLSSVSNFFMVQREVWVSQKTTSMNIVPEGPQQLYKVVLAGPQEYALACQSLTNIL